VEVGAGAIVLGAITIGDGARIAAGSVVVKDVPAGATVIGVPGRIGLGFTPEEIHRLEHGKLPDPIAEALQYFMREHEELKKRVAKIERR
jgi:serine O-acetyltransferase